MSRKCAERDPDECRQTSGHEHHTDQRRSETHLSSREKAVSGNDSAPAAVSSGCPRFQNRGRGSWPVVCWFLPFSCEIIADKDRVGCVKRQRPQPAEMVLTAASHTDFESGFTRRNMARIWTFLRSEFVLIFQRSAGMGMRKFIGMESTFICGTRTRARQFRRRIRPYRGDIRCRRRALLCAARTVSTRSLKV